MPWPPHQVSTFKPTSAEWNAIVDALSTAQGSYNANGQVFSGFLQINITPGVDTDGLVMSPLALVSAGVQVGGRLKLRVNAYDTSNHQTDFLFRPTSRTNAGVSYLSVLYSYDSATPVELARFDTATAALRVGTMAVEATPSTFTGSMDRGSPHTPLRLRWHRYRDSPLRAGRHWSSSVCHQCRRDHRRLGGRRFISDRR